MLPPKFIGAIAFVWVVAALLGAIYEMSYLGGSDQSLFNQILFYDIVTTEGSWGVTELAASAWGYLGTVWRMTTFQFAFVSGEAELVRWIVFFPLTAILVYGVVMTGIGLLRGTIGA